MTVIIEIIETVGLHCIIKCTLVISETYSNSQNDVWQLDSEQHQKDE